MKIQSMGELIDANQQLCRILNSSAKTATEKQKQRKSQTGLLMKTGNDN